MEFMEFTVDLMTGNKLIDSQHKELIDKINALLKACQKGAGKAGAVQMLNYLDDYTKFHFTSEEKLQEDIGYPEIKAHKQKHQEFINTVNELFHMLEEQDGPSDAFVESVKHNVAEWFCNHITTFDRSVAEYINMYENPHRI